MNTPGVRFAAPILVAVSFLVSGCAAPPEAEKKAAEQALATAKTAGADRYAPQEFAAAGEAVRAAAAEMLAKRYADAKASYVRGRELADKATQASAVAKAALRTQLERQVAELEKRWAELRDMLQDAARRLGADQKRAWEGAGRSVADALQAAKDAMAGAPDAAKEQLDAAAAALEKWEAELRALVASARDAAKKQLQKKP